MSGLKDKAGALVDQGKDWIDARWDGRTQAATFLHKPLTRNVGWLHTLGGLVLVYIMFQVLTGILLGLYYSPSPDSAYASSRYIQEELFLGRFVYDLHRFGAGFVIVTAFLHLIRSFVLGSYKAPRELLWITGVMLLILLTLFAFTGQLLPFDQRGYWATIVGIRIASSAPGLGEFVGQLLTGGYGDIGATTLSRFYIMHVSVLPFALFGLIGLHLAILQKVGSSGPIDGSTGPTHPFYPQQAIKDVLVAAGGAFAICIVAALVKSTDTGPANPAAGSFTPRPEWFFLSHYEVLKMMPGTMQIVGTFILPNIVVGLLFLLPFLDRKPDRSFRSRKFTLALGGMMCLTIVGLTVKGVLSELSERGTTETQTTSVSPVEHGRALFESMECIRCHTIAGKGGFKGPELTHVASRLRADFLPDWIRNPRLIMPDTDMPNFEGTEDELADVVAYLLSLK